MSEQPPISELFSTMVEWMNSIGVRDASKGPQPWRGELKTTNDTLTVSLNATGDAIQNIPPYTALIQSERYLAIAVVSPFDGALTGFTEDQLIADFKAATSTEAA